MKYFISIIIVVFSFLQSTAQTYVFAQLSGSPANTTGWSLSGAASVGNVTSTGNSEVIICTNQNYQSGAIFFNQPINLSQCNKWIAEFDMRMFGGSAADGIAFCFLDVPPSGFVFGGGLGIPATANGLKVCFDTYLNCGLTGTLVPKIELRWGAGYDECWAQPTLQNTGGVLSFIRSNNYNHVKIVYINGNIEVFVNNTLYLTGFQLFNFTGYLGFTAATGGLTDDHSIKNVVIYTDMPPSVAGTNQTICSGQTIQLGTAANPNYTYTWSPTANLSASNISNPVFTQINNTANPIITKYFVNTAFSNNSGCISKDSVTITVLPSPGISITSNTTSVCSGNAANFTATLVNAGASPVLQWAINGVAAGTNATTFSSSSLNNGDVITCSITPAGPCALATSNAITITVTPPLNPSIIISSTDNNICQGTTVSFSAIVSNAGVSPSFQWKKNGVNTGTNVATYTDNNLNNGDVISCDVTGAGNCISSSPQSSNGIVMQVNALITPVITIASSSSNICAGSMVNFTATENGGGSLPQYQWKKNGINVGSNTPVFSDNTLNNGDVIECVLTSNASCVTSATDTSNTVTINVSPLLTPFVSVTASSIIICSGTAINFTAAAVNGGTSPFYQWKKNGISVGTNSATYTDNGLSNGDVVSCDLTSNAQCVTSSAATSNNIVMTVNPSTIPSVSIVVSANNVCTSTPVTFNATATNGGTAPSYQWTINGATVGNNSSTFITTALNNNDVVQCNLTSNSSCASPATVASNTIVMNIIALVTPSIVISSSTNGICAGGTAYFIATINNGGTIPVFQWKKNGVNVGTNSNSYADNAIANSDVISCVLISNANCNSVASVTSNVIAVSIFANPVVLLNKEPTICAGSTRLLDAGNFSSYVWHDGSITKTFAVSNTGTYYVTVTDANGCKGSDTVNITTLIPSPANFLPADSAVCAYSRFILAPITNFNSYLWSTNSTSPQIEIRQPGIYWLQATNNNNCTGRDSIIYSVKDCGNSIYYPSAFTPNGDGMNDVFKPLLSNKVDHYKFSVFNRWGQLIYFSVEPLKGWDGTIKGVKQNAQTFVWTCTYQFAGEALKTDKGTITLIR